MTAAKPTSPLDWQHWARRQASERNLTPAQGHVLQVVATWADADGRGITAGLPTIAAGACRGKTLTSEALSDLVELGLIRRVNRGPGRSIATELVCSAPPPGAEGGRALAHRRRFRKSSLRLLYTACDHDYPLADGEADEEKFLALLDDIDHECGDRSERYRRTAICDAVEFIRSREWLRQGQTKSLVDLYRQSYERLHRKGTGQVEMELLAG